MNNTTTHTDASAVKVTRNYAQRKEAILSNPCTHNILKDIVRKLDDSDIMDALHNLECATKLFEQRLEEIKQGIY
jgi:hypothetical protein